MIGSSGERWGYRYGDRWMVQWALDGTFSLGVHVDPVARQAEAGPFGPYVDLHIGPIVVSIGRHPARAGDYARLSSAAIMRPDR